MDDPVNVAKPRKSLMAGQPTNDKLLEWLRKQDEGAPPIELIEMFPVLWEGKENKPILFVPSPSVADRPPNWRSPTIWDDVIFANPREREGSLLTVQGNRILNLDNINWPDYKEFVVVLAGGSEVRSKDDTSGIIEQALNPYQGNEEFSNTVEGPLLVTMYFLKRRGIKVTEIRIIEGANNGNT